VRVVVKTLTDFTGVIQLRAAGEMGGAAWLWTMFLALVVPWVAVPVYFGSRIRDSTSVTDEGEGGGTSVDFKESDAWMLLGGLTAGWVRARAPTPICLPAPCAAEHMCERALGAACEGFYGRGVFPRLPETLSRFCHRIASAK
jgi:hypothetical protein